MVTSYKDIIWRIFFVEQLTEQLTAQEAIVLVATCSETWHAMKIHLAALAFAITRPNLRTMGPPLSVKSWSRLWRMCAASVNHQGISVGFWTRAEKVVWCRDHIRNRRGRELKFSEDHPFLDQMLKYIWEHHFHGNVDLHQVEISAILMLGAKVVQTRVEDITCHALVVLANNELAWICTRHINYLASRGKVWIHEDLVSLLTMVPASWAVHGESLWATCNPFPAALERRQHPFSFEGAHFDVVKHAARTSSAGVARLFQQTNF